MTVRELIEKLQAIENKERIVDGQPALCLWPVN